VAPAKRLLPPLAAFLGATAVAALVASLTGFDPWKAATWARWDSFNYVNIAVRFYAPDPGCTAAAISCGHAGWFPGYPALLAVPANLGLGLAAAGVLVSSVFCFASLCLIWARFLPGATREARVASLLFAAAVPGMIYQHTVFPLSALTFWALLSMLLLSEGRFAYAGLSGAAAAVTYPLGALLAPLNCLWVVLGEGRPGQKAARALLAGGLVACGLASVLILQRVQVGEWLGYFRLQEHPLRTPLAGLLSQLREGTRDGRPAVAAQALFTTALALAVLGLLVWRRPRLSRLDLMAASFTLLVWVVPLCQTGVSLYRSNAALVSAAPLLRHLGAPLRWAFVAGSVALVVPMGVLFFEGRLI
jgi:hypothetical protein